jgi:prevent-host-death family protein
MLTIGSRELKTRLGTYLRRVREGTTLIVTERGRPVAELRPVNPATLDLGDRVSALLASGVLSQEVHDGGPPPPFTPLVVHGRSASALVLEDREDRF